MAVRDRDLGYKNLMNEIRKAHKTRVAIGVLEETTERDDEELTNAEVGAFNEFGEGVPRRSFMRPAFDKNKEKNIHHLKIQIKKELKKGDPDLNDALMKTGRRIQGQIKSTIVAGGDPYIPNAPETVKIKGKNTPLRDTEQLLDSIVVEKRSRYEPS